MFFSSAFAQEAAAVAEKSGGHGEMITLLIQFGLIIVVFYFLLIRPQQKKAKQHQEMVANIKKGDEVVTGGGIVGKVVKVKDNKELIVEIAKGVEVTVLQETIMTVIGGMQEVTPAKVEKK